MMIPEKIYLQYYGSDTLDPEDYDADIDNADVSWCIDRIFDSDIEYVRAPIAKRFDVEKPKKNGEYWAKGIYHARVIVVLDFYEKNPWMRCHYYNSVWYDDGGREFVPKYWCELTLPTIPE